MSQEALAFQMRKQSTQTIPNPNDFPRQRATINVDKTRTVPHENCHLTACDIPEKVGV
ncbi:hypothetical protein SK128_007422, partial [Halocaridina rubra]